jgi:hypothetical protein
VKGYADNTLSPDLSQAHFLLSIKLQRNHAPEEKSGATLVTQKMAGHVYEARPFILLPDSCCAS